MDTATKFTPEQQSVLKKFLSGIPLTEEERKIVDFISANIFEEMKEALKDE